MYGINKTIITSLLVLLLFGFSSTAQCQPQNKFTKQGTVELGGSFSFELNGIDNTAYTIVPYFGWFPIDGFELAFDPISYFSENGEFRNTTTTIYSETNVMILFAPSYNFKISRVSFLCIEGLVGYTHFYANGYSNPPTGVYGGPFTESDSGIAYGGHIGVKVAFSNHALFNIGVQYLRTVYPVLQVMTYGYNDISLVAGFTVVL